MATTRTWTLLLGAALTTACPDVNNDSAGDTTGASTGADATTASPTTSASTSAASTTTGGGSTDATSAGGSTGDPPPPAGCTPEALELIDLVNAYRGENGLAAIPASPSMCIVGQTHVEDLLVNAPHTQPGCNLHSWSAAGAWTPCCYTPDHAQAMCMWMKPQELTDYPGFGYENASSGASTPAQALDGWKNSPAHNEVMLNQGIWVDHPWNALGAGFNANYAVLWFGEETDPAG